MSCWTLIEDHAGASWSFTDRPKRQGQSSHSSHRRQTPGSRSPTPAAAKPRSLRPPSKPAPASRSAEPRDTAARWCDAPASSGPQAELWPDWRHHCVGHQPGRPRHQRPPTPTTAATPESNLPSKTSKTTACAHCPSGKVLRQRRPPRLRRTRTQPHCAGSARLGHAPTQRKHLTVAATARNRLLSVPGRLVNHSGRHILRLPLNWPWKHGLHHSAATPTQPAPAHINARRSGTRAPQHDTPSATNRNPSPALPSLHAPTHARRETRTSPDGRPDHQPAHHALTKGRRWIQA